MPAAPLLEKEALEMLRFPIPRDRSETRDALGSLIVRAPDYTNKFFPNYNIEVGYSLALWGIEAVEHRLRSQEQRDTAARCKDLLILAYHAFKQEDEDLGFKLVQEAHQVFGAIGRRSQSDAGGT